MSYTPKNNFILRMIETGVDLPVYTPENNSNLQLKRTGVGDIGFQEKLFADVACCNKANYQFFFDFNPDFISVSGGIVINILEGCANFSWEITGTDFTLDEATTSVRYNIVRADAGTTIGTTETLTVTDSCGTVIEATIVCCDANVCCDQPDYAFTYSGDNPIELKLATPYKITFEGGCPPFLWQFNQETLILTVTDDCGTVIEIGYIVTNFPSPSPFPPVVVSPIYTNVSTNYATVTIECSCGDVSIGYTTQKMEVNEQQTLTATGGLEECIYSWDISSGSGSLSSSTGLSIVYTAPSTDTYNITITMSVDGVICDSITINAAWLFKLYRDDDTTERDGGGNITTPSGTHLDLTGLLILSIFDSGGNGVGGIPGYDPDYPEYWTFVEVENIWYYDDSEDYPDDPWRGSYNINTGYWKVDMHREALPDEKFWVYYNTAEYGLSQSGLDYKGIQYPYRYKAADRGNTSDMIPVGIYEANVPYWNTNYNEGPGNYLWNPTPIEVEDCTYVIQYPCSEYTGFSLCVSGVPYAFWKDQISFTNKLKTSIPYWVRYQNARAEEAMQPIGYRTLPSSDCNNLSETGTPLHDLVTFISADSFFNKTVSDMVVWPIGYNVGHSTWQERPASISTEDIRTLTLTNNKPHDEYSWDGGQRDLVYIEWVYWNWSQIIFNWDEYEASEYDFF